jgi:hypothetical protein
VTNSYVSLQRFECCFIKDLRDKSHVFKNQNLFAIGSCNARGFLTAMLESVEPKVSELCNFFSWGPDSKHSTLILRALLARQYVVV